MLDYHMHSLHSEDGRMTMDEACQRAVALRLKEICFTDHMDIDWPDKAFTFQIADMDKYIEDVKEMQDKYKNRLTIKLGMEVGMQAHTLDQSKIIVNGYPFDFVIASLHLVNKVDPYLPLYYENRDKKKSYIDYYEAMYEMLLTYNDFCVLGHMDYLRRYSPYPYQNDDHFIGLDIIEAILKHLIDKGKGIEVNTSGYRHLSQQPLPHPDIIKRYRELGGKIITIGSDAHFVEHVGYENNRAIELTKSAGFSYITSFTRLQPSFIKI